MSDSPSHDYRISSDGLSLINDNSEQKIYSGEYCLRNPDECFSMLKDQKEEILKSEFCQKKYPQNCTSHFDDISSHYGKTKVPVALHKKTLASHLPYHVITTIVVPPQIDIHFEYAPHRKGKIRVAKAIVKEQRMKISNSPVNESSSIDNNQYECGYFTYKTGETVEPREKFYDWKDSIMRHRLNATCESGIHAFYTKEEAEEYL
jgi:hypothetical protein